MPLTTGAALIAGLGLIGTPGTASFISKWHLAVGALDRGWWPLVFLLVASSLVSVVYVGRVVEIACFRPTAERNAAAKDPPLSMLLPLLALAAATIYLGLDTSSALASPDRRPLGCLGGCDEVRKLWSCSRSRCHLAARCSLPIFRNVPNLREAVTLTAAIALAAIALALLPIVEAGGQPEVHLIDVAPGLAVAFKVEPLGMLFALVAALLWIVNTVYSIGYMRAHDEPRQTGFYACFAIALGSTIGVAFAEESVHLIPVLRDADVFDFSARRSQVAARKRCAPGALTADAARHLDGTISPRHRVTGSRWHLDFTPGGILDGKAAPMSSPCCWRCSPSASARRR